MAHGTKYRYAKIGIKYSTRIQLNSRLIASLCLMASGLLSLKPVLAQQFYLNANCISQIQMEETCNISFLRRSVSARFTRGTATRIDYNKINAWNYTDSSKLKMDTELAARIGIIGLLFKKVVHWHVFSINYKDSFGDRQSLIVNFSDSQYVNPMLAALRRNNAEEEINWHIKKPRTDKSLVRAAENLSRCVLG